MKICQLKRSCYTGIKVSTLSSLIRKWKDRAFRRRRCGKAVVSSSYQQYCESLFWSFRLCRVGERTGGYDLLRKCSSWCYNYGRISSNMKSGGWDLSKSIRMPLRIEAGLFSPMNEPPGGKARVAFQVFRLPAFGMATQERRRDILFFMDNSSVSPRGSEVSALLGRMPRRVGYTYSCNRDGYMQERITSTRQAQLHQSRLYMCRLTNLPTLPLQQHLHTSMQPRFSAVRFRSLEFILLSILSIQHPGSYSRYRREAHYNCAQRVKELLQRYNDSRI